LVGLTVITVVEAISYAWIEVLLYTSDNSILYHAWLFGHYTTYHLALAVLVLAMIFGVGYVAFTTFSRAHFRKFFLLCLGNFSLWIMLEDEFTFVFTGSPHTATDWTNWPIGAPYFFGYYIPLWYFAATGATLTCWFFGLFAREEPKEVRVAAVN
jgi:hypothetical protein